MTRSRDQWDHESRMAQTARARAVSAAAFAERVEAYRALTREEGLTPLAALRALGLTDPHAITKYEYAITGLSAAERRAVRQGEYAQLRADGMSRAEAARRIGINSSTAKAWDRASSGHVAKAVV